MPEATCAFCRIAGFRDVAYIVFEDKISVAFLDHRPLFPGHCLLVPKRHIETIADLPPELTGPIFENVKLLGRAVEEAVEADGAFIAVNNKVSQSIPHFHVHVVPRRHKDGLKGFFWPRHPYRDQKHLLETQRAIAARMEVFVPRIPEV
jgi:histidine triad (HIT) family protein